MALQFLLVFILLIESSLMLESIYCIKIARNETDRLALLEFKKQIDLDPYGALSSWNDSMHFCNWVGITCSHHHQKRVISLDLQGKGLRGNISPSIGNLSFLHFLDIGNNSFHGKIPQEINNLIRLRVIVFENNTLEGDIPTKLANCTRLREIHFSGNNLVGEIPSELFTSLSKLEKITMNENSFTGEIPASFGNASSLQVISLTFNKLQGRILESLGKLRSLRSLSLDGNKFSGMVPLSLYNLSSLQELSLLENQLHGSLPQDIGITLPNLEFLGIALNKFSGRIPNSVSNLSRLGTFDLMSNNFIGPVPANLGNLQYLQRISVSENQCGTREVGDLDFLNSLINCTNLEILSLSVNQFKGPIPKFKANVSTQLSMLLLGGNQISGTIPIEIKYLVSLTALSMNENFIEGNIPFVIGELSNLQRLFLGGNKLSGHIPSSIGNLSLLYELHLEENSLNGSIPSSIGECQKLEFVTLNNNHLQGPVPKQLFLISSLSISLDISSNSLVGPLPNEIGNLKSLSTIDISKNRLFREIPSSIGDCKSLEHLYMGGNYFEGTIPQSLTLLKGLEDLDLSLNNLSGPILEDLQNLFALQSLNLSFNNLEGEIPIRGIFGNASAISVKGNANLCGGIPELQLPPCVNHASMKQEKSHAFRILMETIGVVLGVLLISSFFILRWKRISKRKLPSTPLVGEKFLNLSYKELFQATGGFSSTNFIGSGAFGSVYKGIINQGEIVVAVKVLNLQDTKVYKSFTTECEVLRNIRHRNLVKILTSCSSLDSKGEDFKALVYEFMPNGNLDDWLHPKMEENSSQNLSFRQRLNIAIDVASALDYLHYHCYVAIVHCDLKPSNILLDIDMTAHVSDFGLARLLVEADDNSSRAQTSTIGIKGSIGYAAPEYGMGGMATIHGDMFSYGILLLEMLIGKKPTDQMFIDGLNLHNFAKAALPTRIMQILDPSLLPRDEQGVGIEEDAISEIEHPSHNAEKLLKCTIAMIEIALQCSMELPRERMNMNEVVRRLHSIKEELS